ncbi:MAG: SDR family NAD(P)-dependent oxidoreductase [Dehalococcoidia bacterium]|nr:SDR family NAD(P)-dependent oxidoreductase [Dehalococcoidia bacterium]
MGALDDNVVVVTGGGRGIGRAVARLAAAEGAAVVIVDNGCEVDGTGENPRVAAAVAEEIVAAGGKAEALAVDVSTMAGAQEVADRVLGIHQRIDGLVCAAGIRRDAPFARMAEADWDAVIDGNLKATFTMVRQATAVMRGQGSGHVVLLTSDLGLGSVGAANYAASTEGLIGMNRTVARDVGRTGVTCNAVSPLARTRMFAGGSEELRPTAGIRSADAVAGIARFAPTARWDGEIAPDDPSNVAPLVCFLMTPAADNVNGALFGVRGGDIYLYAEPAVERQIFTYGGRFTLDQLDELMPRTLAFGVDAPIFG